MQSEQKTRYSDSELREFKALIVEKLKSSREELADFLSQMSIDNEKVSLSDYSAVTEEKEYLGKQAGRKKTFIQNLENALIRIENKTYGICRITGNLIPKGRLLAVPHATLCMEAKLKQSAA
ncbi:MAG TPA: TraR/DksA C4-type zinc finger protein [Candidatus Paceibacterota bacterium]